LLFTLVFLVVADLEGENRYAWGKVGSSSSVATLKQKQNQQLGIPFLLDEAKPYAELWIGTHPSAPSKVDGKLLSDVISQNPSKLIGEKTVQVFGGSSLPFLLKVCARKRFFFFSFLKTNLTLGFVCEASSFDSSTSRQGARGRAAS